MNLPDEAIRARNELERDMDDGVQPFVVLNGQRFPVSEEDMARFDLKNGQTITAAIFDALVRSIAEKHFGGEQG